MRSCVPDRLRDLRLSSAAASRAFRCSMLPFLAPIDDLCKTRAPRDQHVLTSTAAAGNHTHAKQQSRLWDSINPTTQRN